MHALLLLSSLLLPQSVSMVEPQAVLPESTLVSRPASLPAYRLAAAGRRQEGPFEYSDAYAVRLKIHKIASFATVPLFVLQYIAGQQLIEHEGGGGNGFREDEGEGEGGLAEWHGTLAAGVAGLFAVNTITGGWNLLEARKDPENRTWRTMHGLLELAADAGFVVTGLTAGSAGEGNGGTHKTVAVTSMGVALVGYLMMLPPFRRD